MSKFMKENKKLIRFTIIMIAIILTLGIGYVGNAIDAEPVTLTGTEEIVNGLILDRSVKVKANTEVVATYTQEGHIVNDYNSTTPFAHDVYSVIDYANESLPDNPEGVSYGKYVTTSILNKYSNVYCCRKGKGLGAAGNKFIIGHEDSVKGTNYDITGLNGFLDGYKFTDVKIKAPTKITIPKEDFKDWQDNSEKNHVEYTGSDFKMFYVGEENLKDITNDGEGVNNPSANVIPYACCFETKYDWYYRDHSLTYWDSGIQEAVWDVAGQFRPQNQGVETILAGRAIDEFDNLVLSRGNEVTISTVDLPSAGPDGVIRPNIGSYYVPAGSDGTNRPDMYRVGPFTVNDFAFGYSSFVAERSGQGLKYPELIGGIEGGTIILTTDAENDPGHEFEILGAEETEGMGTMPQISFVDPYGTPTDIGDTRSHGDFLMEAPYVQFPHPNSVFYIDIPKGNGYCINIYYIKHKWELQKDGTTDEYYCPFCKHESEAVNNSEVTDPSNGSTYNHSHFNLTLDESAKNAGEQTCNYNYNLLCSTCNGDKGWTCTNCGGTGRVTCSICDGTGTKDCPKCDGSGEVDDGQGGTKDCGRCGGDGEVSCPKTESCSVCGGDGWVTCTTCDGLGYTVESGSHTCIPKSVHSCEEAYPEGFNAARDGYYEGVYTGIGKGQPFMVIEAAKVEVLRTPYLLDVNVRLTTDLQIKKYVSEVKHETTEEVTFGDNVNHDNPELVSDQTPAMRRDMEEAAKEADPVYVEQGDLVKFTIEIANYQNYQVKAMIQDVFSEDTAEVMERTFLDNDWIIVPGGTKDSPGRTTLSITLRVNAPEGKFYNEAEFSSKNIPLIKDIDKNIDFIRTTDNLISPVVNVAEIEHPETGKSKDFYTLNDYKASIYKYVYEYNAEMTEKNNAKGFTNEDNVLEDRYEQNGNLVTEEYKERYPVAVEKTETFSYGIRVRNDSVKTPDNDVATRVRPTEIVDTLDKGLEYVDGSIKGYMYGKDGELKYELDASTFTITNTSTDLDTVYTIRLADKQGDEYTCIEPGGYLLYTMTVKVIKTNMYLDKMANRAEIGILTNINNFAEGSKEITCPTCNGKGKTVGFTPCTSCTGEGKYPDTITCPVCRGSGHPLTDLECETCHGEGMVNETCDHQNHGDTMVSIIWYCHDCGYQFNGARMSDHGGHHISLISCERCGQTHDGTETGTAQVVCPDCHGLGTQRSTENCTECGGTAKITVERVCPICHGSDNVTTYVTCEMCGGSKTHTITTGGDRIVYNRDGSVDTNIGDREVSAEYVRLKDLVIAGRVWLDKNKDGLMPTNGEGDPSLSNPPVDHEGKQTTEIVYSDAENNSGAEKPMKGIVVKLYYKDGTLVRTTKTDSTGLFTFAKDENLNWLTPSTYERTGANGTTCTVVDSVQRVDKADNKDADKNYQANSQYYEYYIEYEYDGVAYKSTEIYADDSHINNDGSYVDPYRVDSNAYEITSVREEFNKKYEFISFNHAQNANGSFTANLSFEKKEDEHKSFLEIDPERLMTARSFINRQTGADQSQYVNGFYADGTTKYLWLKKFDAAVNETPETEYLKYINLGLQEREDADISLLKDVYEIKTTVNGEEVTYSLDQLRAERDNLKLGTGDAPIENGRIGNAGGPFLQDYITKKPYGLDIYEADYKFRMNDYEYAAVQNYKNIDSEMNVEVTYKITIDNRSIKDDYKDDATWKDTQLDLTVNEIVDFYDENYIPIFFGADGTMNPSDPNNKLSIKRSKDDVGDALHSEVADTHRKDVDGNEYVVLRPQDVAIAAAWYYDNNEVYNSEGKENTRHYLTLKDKTSWSANNELLARTGAETERRTDAQGETQTTKTYVYDQNRASNSGYNTVYITGMENIKIEEGKQLDIFVKYTLDKEDGVEVLGDVLDRALEILEKHPGTKDASRGSDLIEGVATVGTYSLWYTTSGKEAAIVDCDSNVANLGYKANKTYTNIDDVDLYEDTSYKVDYKLNVVPAEEPPEIPDNPPDNPPGTPDDPNYNLVRAIRGTVWDDSRSEADTINSSSRSASPAQISKALDGNTSEQNNDLRLMQYSGNGLLQDGDSAKDGKINEVVTAMYKDASTTEEKDIKVRSAKAEYVEIIPIPDADGKGVKYYEEKRPNTTATCQQNTRTDENGDYVLWGFTPGYYIVRFTYGDTQVLENGAMDAYNVNEPYKDEASTLISDMLIFNGQDYKSSLYKGVDDAETDEDNIIIALTDEARNDARDDEIKRLQSIAYSERMINYKAEILKGLGNGLSLNGRLLTPNDEERNDKTSLEMLLDKTNMYADTNKFYVKPEKLDKLFDKATLDSIKLYSDQNVNNKNQLYSDLFKVAYDDATNTYTRKFDLNNIDFGIEYRPETEVSLEKEIKYVKLLLASDSEDKPTVELYFNVNWDGDTKTIDLDLSRSIGQNVTQIIPNWYTRENNRYNLLSELVDADYEGQGWVNIQMDYEILQGARVEIRYDYTMNNDSEADRISKNLDELRYRENKEATKLYNDYVLSTTIPEEKKSAMMDILKEEYTASGLASLYLKDIYGVKNKEVGAKHLTVASINPGFPTGEKTVDFDLCEGDVIYRTRKRVTYNPENYKPEDKGNIKNGYYGMFLGNYYYLGKDAGALLDNDIVSQTKFVGVLDYVDTDLRYNATEQEAYRYKDGKWTETYAAELRELGLLKDGSTDPNINIGIDDTAAGQVAVEGILNPDNVVYGDLILTDSDRVKDIDEYAGEEDPTVNVDMTRYLYPNMSSTIEVRLEETLPSDVETNRPEIEYENLGEIVELTTQTGRRTNFDTTIGNVYFDRAGREDITGKPSSPEFIRASYEPDTAATELISINPNPGMTRKERQIHTAIKNTLNTTMVATLVLAVVVIGTISTTVVIKKIKNKPIK